MFNCYCYWNCGEHLGACWQKFQNSHFFVSVPRSTTSQPTKIISTCSSDLLRHNWLKNGEIFVAFLAQKLWRFCDIIGSKTVTTRLQSGFEWGWVTLGDLESDYIQPVFSDCGFEWQLNWTLCFHIQCILQCTMCMIQYMPDICVIHIVYSSKHIFGQCWVPLSRWNLNENFMHEKLAAACLKSQLISIGTLLIWQ